MRNPQPKHKVDSKRAKVRSTSPEVAAAARKVADSKRAERERRLKAQRTRLKVRLVVSVVLAGALIVGVVATYRSQLFEVRTVSVQGNDRLSEEEILEIAAMPEGATLLRFPGAAMKRRLEENAWVAEALVSRDFPDTVVIRIVERVPTALVDVGGETFWLVDESGFMITQATPEDTATPVVIRDIAGLDPRAGTRTSSEPLLNALAVWNGISEELRARTRAISAPSIDKTALITTDDVEIFFGSVDEVSKKDAVARSILEKQAGTVVYINVRTVDHPTWRGIDE